MWVLYAIGFAVTLLVYLLLTLLIAAFEKSGHYVEVTAVTAGAAVLFECMLAIPRRRMRLAEQWAAGQEIDRATALEGTYSLARRLSSQMAWSTGVWAALLSVVVGRLPERLIAAGPIRDPRRRLWNGRRSDRFSQHRGGSAAAGEGRPRR